MDETLENTVESSKKRDDQGNHECEVWACSETFDHRQELNGEEGSREWEKCEKNPGHTGFISAPDFSLLHLPEEYRTREILELVQAQADLTVRLRVGYTSANRPDGYPFSNFRGRYIPHTGTGVVTTVCHEQWGNSSDSSEDDYYSDEEEKEDDRNEETKRRDFEAFERESRQPLFTGANCPCHDCEDTRSIASLNQTKPTGKQTEGAMSKYDGNHLLSRPGDDRNRYVGEWQKLSQGTGLTNDFHTNEHLESETSVIETQEKPCWLVFIETALHVVYDTDEAKHTVVDVFYDRNDRTERPQSLYGFCADETSKVDDRCKIRCCTHNENLVRKLVAASTKRRHLARYLGRPAVPPSSESLNSSSKNQNCTSTLVLDNNYVATRPPIAATPTLAPTGSSVPINSKPAAASLLTTENSSVSTIFTPTATSALAPQASHMAIIIGHPHGRSKTVSIGHWMERVKESEYKDVLSKTYYIYNTPTCKANSGGSVMTFGKVEEERATVVIFTHRHRASCETPGLNMSSPSDEVKTSVFQQTNKLAHSGEKEEAE
ncbi:hypothetical protein PoB_004091900 [Plakobranchus ocellatus]|uniref:Uncharacterized protein n=1 Tax=Plakobranchus ocellatus TaxID=259542 RepID=A0AAV4B7U5_9GAST|nr:hypothetical protein PoB_004091900 [Plakobranchus ocellatus]